MNEKKSVEGARVVMNEAQPSGSVTDGCAVGAASLGAVGFDEGLGAGCISMMFALLVAGPFILISAADRFFRRLFRSRVDVRFTVDHSDTIASFAFYGPGGYVLSQRYAEVFATPLLPEAVFPPASGPAEQLPEDEGK